MPKIVQYNLPPGGTVTQIADNQVALDIESTDAVDYIRIDTTNGAEEVLIGDEGATIKMGVGTDSPDAAFSVRSGGANSRILELENNTGGTILRIEQKPTNQGEFTMYGTGGSAQHKLATVPAGDGVIFNDLGENLDFRVESDNNTHMLFVDGSEDKVGIGDTAPASMLGVKGDLNTQGAGTITSIATATVTGSGTSFLSKFSPGSAIQFTNDADATEIRTVSSVSSNTELVLTETPGATGSGRSTKTYFHDPSLFQIKTGDDKVQFNLDKHGHIQIMDGASTNSNLVIGDSTYTGAGITTGTRNTLIGRDTGRIVSTGSHNVLLGDGCGVALTTGNYNTFIGRETSGGSATVARCVVIGAAAGSASAGGPDTVAIGYQAGSYNGSARYYGSNSVLIGSNACPGTSGDTNNVVIGKGALGHGAHSTVLGNASCTQIDPGSDRGADLGQVSYEFDAVHCVSVTEVSDERLKEQIEDTSLGVDFIKRLRPVSYKFKDREAEYGESTETVINENGEEVEESIQVLRQPALMHTRKHQGLIAQEVKQVLDDIGMDTADFGGYVDGNISGGGDRYALRYRQFIAPLIKAVQELTARIEELENDG